MRAALKSSLTALKRFMLGVFLVAVVVTSEALGSSPGSRRALMADPSATIAFVHQGEVDTVDVVDSRGARVRELMQDAGAVEVVAVEGHRSGLDWSRDGRRMLVRSNRGLRALERDGSFSPVPFGRSCDLGSQVSWSPDSKRVACEAATASASSAPRAFAACFGTLAPATRRNTSPLGRRMDARSPMSRGSKPAKSGYTTSRATCRGRIPSTSGGALVHAPTWSPNSELLAFSNHCRSGCKPTIWTVHRDGHGLKRVILDGLRPAWSPDGKEMAFDSGRDGDFEIFVLTLATGNVRQLTRNHVDDLSAVWR